MNKRFGISTGSISLSMSPVPSPTFSIPQAKTSIFVGIVQYTNRPPDSIGHHMIVQALLVSACGWINDEVKIFIVLLVELLRSDECFFDGFWFPGVYSDP